MHMNFYIFSLSRKVCGINKNVALKRKNLVVKYEFVCYNAKCEQSVKMQEQEDFHSCRATQRSLPSPEKAE